MSADDKNLDLDAMKLEKLKHETELKRLQVEIKKGELIPLSDFSLAVSYVATAAKGILDAVPLEIKTRCPSIQTAALDIVIAELAKARNQLVNIQIPESLGGESDEEDSPKSDKSLEDWSV